MNSKSKSAYGLLAPSLIILAIMTLVPMIYNLYISTQSLVLSKGPTGNFIGLTNYITVLQDGTFWKRLATTGIYTVMSVGMTIVLGLALALLLQRTSRTHTFIKMLLIFPYAISPAIKGYMWRFMLAPDGLFDRALDTIFPWTADYVWLAMEGWSLFWVATTEVWGWTPMVALMFLGALGQINPSVFEAASLDGVKNTQMFRYITFPLVRPVVISTTILKTIFSLKMYDTIVTMTGGGPGDSTQTINYYIYQNGFKFTKLGYAAAMALLVCIIVIMLVAIYVRSKKKEESV